MGFDDFLSRYAPLTPVPGAHPLVAHQADDVFALWLAWEQMIGARQEVPFWATVWPAARVLARWVLDHPAATYGRRVLELGCGGGTVAIAAALSGASNVIANDIDHVALDVAHHNAAANGVRIDLHPHDVLGDPGSLPPVDLVFVADLFYEREQAARTLMLLGHLQSRGTRVVVADAGRPFAPTTGFALLEQHRVAVDRGLEGVDERLVSILERVKDPDDGRALP